MFLPGIVRCSGHRAQLIFKTLSFFMSSYLAIIRTVNRRSPYPICHTRLTLTSLLLVVGFPQQESFFTSLRLSLNLLCNSKTRVRDMLFLYTWWIISSACNGVFSTPPQKKSFIRSSVLMAERPENRCKQKHVKNKCKSCRKLRLQLYTPKIT